VQRAADFQQQLDNPNIKGFGVKGYGTVRLLICWTYFKQNQNGLLLEDVTVLVQSFK
jgi:muramoyltetrapeptide carboxypeptidase